MVEITPYVGVGELQFGMHCDEVRELLGEAYRRTTGTPPATGCAPAS